MKNRWQDKFESGDFEPRRSVRSKVQTEEQYRDGVVDFIKTYLDSVLYNQYKNSLDMMDFSRTISVIDNKIIPEISFLLDFEGKNINEVRRQLLYPIMEAAGEGNISALEALRENAEYVESRSASIISRVSRATRSVAAVVNSIDPAKYEEAVRLSLARHLDLVEIFNSAIIDKDLDSLRVHGRELVDRLKEELGEGQYRTILHDMANISRDMRERTSSAAEESDTSIVHLESIQPNIIIPEKYEESIRSSLLKHNDLVGKFNIASVSENLHDLKIHGRGLIDRLKEDLDEGQYRPILYDMANISRAMSANANSRASAATLEKDVDNEATEIDTSRPTAEARIAPKGYMRTHSFAHAKKGNTGMDR